MSKCPTCGRDRKRSSEANRRYWRLMTEMSANLPVREQRFSPEVWHQWSKLRFLGADDVRLPTGKTLIVPKSSADLSTSEFSDYMTQVEAFANGHGVFLDE